MHLANLRVFCLYFQRGKIVGRESAIISEKNGVKNLLRNLRK